VVLGFIVALVSSQFSGYLFISDFHIDASGLGLAVMVAWTFAVAPLHHELAHAWVARRQGIAVAMVGFHGSGAYVTLRPDSTGVTPRGWIKTLAAGPISNLGMGVALLACWLALGGDGSGAPNSVLLSVAAAELLTALLNAVPHPRTDGGAIREAFRLARASVLT
jgi:Zn-dependent protease